MKKLTILLLITATFSAAASAFTYQGKLMNSGDPADGKYDMLFTLYDKAVDGEIVTKPLSMHAVPVSRGYFNVELQFDASAATFNGQERWLEVALRPVETTKTYDTLKPRQKVTPVAQARRAASAAVCEPLEFMTSQVAVLDVEGISYYFHYFDGITSQVEVIEQMVVNPDGTQTIVKRPGRTKYSNIALKRFLSADQQLFSWAHAVTTGTVDRKILTLSIADSSGTVLKQWNMSQCWPCGITYDYDPQTNAVVETLTLATEQIQAVANPASNINSGWESLIQPQCRSFLVSIPDVTADFDRLNNLGFTTEVIEYQDGEDLVLRKRPGRSRYSNVNFYQTANQPSIDLETWFSSVADGSYPRKNISVKFFSNAGTLLRTLSLTNSWPCLLQNSVDDFTRTVHRKCTIVTEALTEI